MLRGVFCHDIAYLKVHSGLLDDVNPDGAYCKQKEQPEITRYVLKFGLIWFMRKRLYRNGGLGMDRREKESTKSKIYIRYDEGAERYSMCRHTFMKLAAEAGAVYKINRLSLVNTKIFEEYLETFRVSV